ncbi:MAG: ABC transporter ATP-binding protein [Firmicutes bacterium]|jgi:multiple sugar transport system ATP-binding protein|nr:ABC transporter ATP-binding protein [Bacillota bacterium]
MARVLLDGVTKRFGNVIAVNDIDLEVKDREFVVLVGPSGCGKTTTLRMIAGLEEITKGTISIGDTVVNDIPPKDRDIAMVFQNYALYPHMDVYNNMAFGLKLRKFPKSEIDRRVKEAARMLGIENLLDRKPKQLSGGQRQRVAVGRAIVREPKVFLMDEPLSNLDAKLRVQMRAELSKLHQSLQATIIYVTHDQIEAMTMGDRIVVMRDGFIQQVASPLVIYNHPSNVFVGGFIGSPPMNFMNMILTREDGRYYVETIEGRVKLEIPPERVEYFDNLDAYVEKEVIFGIRPEDIEDFNVVKQTLGEEAAKNSFTANVDVIEPMGAETYLYLSLDEEIPQIIARVDAQTDAVSGEQHKVAIDMSKCQLFDKDTEKTLRKENVRLR